VSGVSGAAGRQRAAGAFAIAVGLAIVLGARVAPGLGGPPLYDGVVPVGPYLWLDPGPGQQGGAQGAKATVAVIGGKNDVVALATGESLPQAQMLAVPGDLVLPPGATSIAVSITPVAPAGQPADGVLASNVYRFELADQAGAAVKPKASGKVSVVLRSADASLQTGVVERFDGSVWTALTTAPPGVGGVYLAVVKAFGDYAVVQPGPIAPSGSAAASGPLPASSGAAASGTTPGGASATPAGAPGAGSGAGSGGLGLALPIGAAAGIALLALVVMLAAQRRSGPPARATRPYRGAHPKDRD
jgi:hypothetical protein